MIHLTDASKLAYTKLRTRRIRLGITVFISALIFSILAAASFIGSGVFHSIESFSQEGFGSRYVMQAIGVSSSTDDVYMSKEVLDRAESLQKAEIERKKIEAKKLGIEYDPMNEPKAVEQYDGPNGKERSLNQMSRSASQAMQEHYKANPLPGDKELKEQSKEYNPVGFYESISLPMGGPSSFSLAVLKEGKENYEQKKNQEDFFKPGIDSFTSSWQVMSKELLQPFLLPEQSADITSDGFLPVVAPYTAVEQLLGMKPLPSDAKPDKKLERLKEVRAKASEIKFSVCYRNQASSDLLQQTISTKQEIERNKNTKDYQKPSLIYGLPKKPCGPIPIETDTRTTSEKEFAEKDLKFRMMFGEEAPKETILKFRVIGIGPDPADFSGSTVNNILRSFLASNLGPQATWITPIEARSNNPLLKTFFPENPTDPSQMAIQYIELPNADMARSFLKNENCEPSYSAAPVEPDRNFNPTKQCIDEGKEFMLYPFGSSSLALDEAKKGFAKVFRIASIVITIIAAIIMIGTVGRVIADSRRETAVFRAIGAKRLDIAQIYFTYTVFLAALVAVTAMLIGFILASIADSKWADGMTIEALVAYNAQDLSREFHLYGFNSTQLMLIIGLIVLAGIASAVLPLLTNIRRNPINDMRDEN
jgi:hypothetical protein